MEAMNIIQEPAPIKRDTALYLGGEITTDLMQFCTAEIESLSMQIVRTADAGRVTGMIDDLGMVCELRAAALRVKSLNSLLMTFFQGPLDSVVTIGDADFRLNGEATVLLARD